MANPPEEIRQKVAEAKNKEDSLLALTMLAVPFLSLGIPAYSHHGYCGLCKEPIRQGDGVRETYKNYGRCHGRCAMKHEGPQPKLSRKKKRPNRN